MIQEDLAPGVFDCCITSYELVNIERNALKKIHWRYLIIDEAHRIKNENSSLARNVRLMDTQNRLLITGTPLQNNLHELWALLNFLLPEVFFDSSQVSWYRFVIYISVIIFNFLKKNLMTSPNTTLSLSVYYQIKNKIKFEQFFEIGGGSGSGSDDARSNVVQKLHKILHPFLLRRIKADVAKDLPPKKETKLYIGMTEMQRFWYSKVLSKDMIALNSLGGPSRMKLLNVLMQLRKVIFSLFLSGFLSIFFFFYLSSLSLSLHLFLSFFFSLSLLLSLFLQYNNNLTSSLSPPLFSSHLISSHRSVIIRIYLMAPNRGPHTLTALTSGIHVSWFGTDLLYIYPLYYQKIQNSKTFYDLTSHVSRHPTPSLSIPVTYQNPAGKFALLEKLLPKLKQQSSRVLIFSQMTRILDIMEDFMRLKRYGYCRIDGSTPGEVRDEMMDVFNAPNSSKFCFLLSTRAGGLGINLHTADVVVLYDSDWNPQVFFIYFYFYLFYLFILYVDCCIASPSLSLSLISPSFSLSLSLISHLISSHLSHLSSHLISHIYLPSTN